MRKLLFTLVLVAVAIVASHAGDITANGMFQGDLFTFLSNVTTMTNEVKSDFNNSRTAMQAMALGNPTLSSGTIAVVMPEVDFSIGGVAYTKASATPTLTAAAQTARTSCKYLISVNAAGTATATKGVEVADTLVLGAVTTALPAVPASHCPLGYITISASAAWTMGTTAYGVATTTFTSVTFLDNGSSVSTTDLTLTGL